MVGGERTGVEEAAPILRTVFLSLSLFFPSIFPSRSQAAEIGEKRNAGEQQSA